jgi:hypothetical protein
MNEYTASNTATVQRFAESLEVKLFKSATWLTPWEVKAVREFFRAEEDERLGRWRWPENPDYVVYPIIEPAHEIAFGSDLSVMILHEPTGVLKGYCRAEDQGGRDREYPDAARAYFDAHPEPKPWHDAKEGEVWALRFEDDDDEFAAFKYGTRWKSTEGGWPNEDLITAGRRIWPKGD